MSLKIDSLKNEYRTDYGGLNNFLNKIKYALVPALAILVNKCFEEGVFSKCLKRAIVRPSHKVGSLMKWKITEPLTYQR